MWSSESDSSPQGPAQPHSGEGAAPGAAPRGSVLARLRQHAANLAIDLQRHGRDPAVRQVLDGELGRWLLRSRLMRDYRMREEDAEELLIDILMRFIDHPPQTPEGALGWLCHITYSQFCDWDRARKADKRDGEEGVSPEHWARLAEGVGDGAPAIEQRTAWRQQLDCVQRQLHAFAQSNLRYAELIRMKIMEFTNEEIASVWYGVEPHALTPEHGNRIKSTLSSARKAVMPYLAECA